MTQPFIETGAECSLAMDAESIQIVLRRMAHDILEHCGDVSSLVLAGIPTRGVEVARRLGDQIFEAGGVRPFVGAVDVSMHRDDIGTRSRLTTVVPTELPHDLAERTLVIVDDVFYTGRSARAALDAIASFGRPARIQLAVLVDRGHRELPIRADYVGKNLTTTPSEKIRVRFENLDGVPDSVRIVR